MTAPKEREQDSEARVSLKINERFKSLSIRNIKNHSTTTAIASSQTARAGQPHSLAGGALGRRRNMAGIKHLKDIGTVGSSEINRNFSP